MKPGDHVLVSDIKDEAHFNQIESAFCNAGLHPNVQYRELTMGGVVGWDVRDDQFYSGNYSDYYLRCAFTGNRLMPEDITGNRRKEVWKKGELPPIGTVCFLRGESLNVLVIAHANVGSPHGIVAVYQACDDISYIDWAVREAFMPIQSDRDKWLEKADSIVRTNAGGLYDEASPKDVALFIYKAMQNGDLPSPE